MITNEKNRIYILDSFRCIAILMVIIYHYTTISPTHHQLLFKNDIYKYAWQNGRLGVQLFFMISGFVIFMTLEKSNSFKEFLIKRLVRLFPMLLICSLITFLFPFIIDHQNLYPIFHPKAEYFLPSLTFTDLWMYKLIFKHDMEFIDNSYWSLAAEMKFYILSATIYFFNKNTFFKNWFIFTIVSTIFYCIAIITNHLLIAKMFSLCLISDNVIFFSLGMFFYVLFKKKYISLAYHIVLFFLFLGMSICVWSISEIFYFILFIFIFYSFVYQNWLLSFLNNSLFVSIGIASYPLYLIHQTIGKLSICKINDLFGLTALSWQSILAITVVMLIVSFYLNKYLEVPMGRFFRKLILKQ